MRIVDVGLIDPGGTGHDTLVLSGIDLEVPLEADLDGDPLHDDEVRLVSEEGEYEATLTAGHPDVRFDKDKNLYVYRFREVPQGFYRLQVRVGDEDWATVASDLAVYRDKVTLGAETLGTELAKIASEDAPVPDEDEPSADEQTDEGPVFMDVADSYFEENP